MLLGYRALLLGGLALSLLSGCGHSSYGSDSGVAVVSTTTGTGTTTGSTAKPGFTLPGTIAGANDVVVATASVDSLAVVVGATQTVSITFNSSDGLAMTGFGVSGTLGTLPAGWSGPATFVCASVSTGSGCVMNLSYAPTAVDSGSITVGYVVVDNASIAQTNGSITVTYVATPSNNIVTSVSPTGQVVAMVGGGAQSVGVDFTTDDGNPATNLTVSTDLTSLPAGWTVSGSSFACAIVTTGNGCRLSLGFAPSAAASGVLTLEYAYTDDNGLSKTGTLTIPYFTTSANDVVATASPAGQITAVQNTGSQTVPITFTTDNGKTATSLAITSNLKALPAGWNSAASTFTCGSVSTGNGCQLALKYAPTALGSGTLALTYSYVDGSGMAKTGLVDVPYAATTNDNVVGTPSPMGQINAVVGMGTQTVTVTFATDDSRPATALQLTTDLSMLPAGWSSTVASLTCVALDSDAVCQLPLAYAPSAAGNGTLSLGYSYLNNAGQAKTGTVSIAYRATTNDNIVGTASPTSLAVRTGSNTTVAVTFTTDDGNPASALAVTTVLTSLPAGWTAASNAFACTTVSIGSSCLLSLTYAPAVADSGTLSLGFSYANDAGIAKTGTATIAYSATTPYLYVANSGSVDLSTCPLNIDNSLAACGTTGFGFTIPLGLALDGNVAYVTNDSGTPGNLVSECTLGSAGTLASCVSTGGSFTSPTSMVVNPAGTFAYIDSGAGLSVCAVNASTGVLSACTVTASTFAPLAGLALSADGTHAYAVHGPSAIDVCAVSAVNGTLSGCATAAAAVTQAAAVLALQNNALYVSTSAGAVYVCAVSTADGSVASCQTTAVGSNAAALAFIGSTAYVSTLSTSVLVCPVNVDGTFGTCATFNDPTFNGAAGMVVR